MGESLLLENNDGSVIYMIPSGEGCAMKTVIITLIKFLPLIFGVGFVAPLVGQGLIHIGIDRVWGMSSLVTGLLVGGTWGAIATKTGRWI
jgi:hypothetical protein